MKRITILIICVIAGLVLTAPSSPPVTITFEAIPDSVDSFLELRDSIADTPEGGAAVFVAAMVMYSNDNETGLKALTIALDSSTLSKTTDVYKGYTPNSAAMYHIINNLKPRPYLARSYVQGTTPENKYTIPDGPVEVVLTRNAYSLQGNGDIKVFVACSGADSPRPLIMRENNRGLWKAVNYSSLFVGIRKPVEEFDDEL